MITASFCIKLFLSESKRKRNTERERERERGSLRIQSTRMSAYMHMYTVTVGVHDTVLKNKHPYSYKPTTPSYTHNINISETILFYMLIYMTTPYSMFGTGHPVGGTCNHINWTGLGEFDELTSCTVLYLC